MYRHRRFLLRLTALLAIACGPYFFYALRNLEGNGLFSGWLIVGWDERPGHWWNLRLTLPYAIWNHFERSAAKEDEWYEPSWTPYGVSEAPWVFSGAWLWTKYDYVPTGCRGPYPRVHVVGVSLWPWFGLSLAATGWAFVGARPPAGHCRCGYDLTGNTSGACPECGADNN